MIVNTGEFDFLLFPVDDWIMFFQPIESQEDRVGGQFGYRKHESFRVFSDD